MAFYHLNKSRRLPTGFAALDTRGKLTFNENDIKSLGLKWYDRLIMLVDVDAGSIAIRKAKKTEEDISHLSDGRSLAAKAALNHLGMESEKVAGRYPVKLHRRNRGVMLVVQVGGVNPVSRPVKNGSQTELELD